MDLSICIASYNTSAELANTLSAAAADSSQLSSEIIIVDNGSSDGSSEMVKKSFPGVTLIKNKTNRYFSAAYNQAFAISNGRYILALNSDVEILPGTLDRLVAYLDARSEIGAVTCKMLFPDGRIQMNCARFIHYPYLLLEHSFLGLLLPSHRSAFRHYRTYGEWDRSDPREVDVIPGSFIMSRSEVIKALGGFDEHFRLYFSDDDLCWRMQQAQHQIMYIPDGCVIHPEGSSSKRIPRLARHLYFKDMYTYAHRYFGRPQSYLLRFLASPTLWGMEQASMRSKSPDRIR